jgi:hypothetical protein
MWNDYAKCLWELDSWYSYIMNLWDPTENYGGRIGKAGDFQNEELARDEQVGDWVGNSVIQRGCVYDFLSQTI